MIELKSKYNNFVYNFLKTHYFITYKNKSVQLRLERLESLSKFLFMHFSFYLADFEIEEEIKKIAKEEFSNFQFPVSINSEKKNILHLATEVYDTGGHTRVIRNWIEEDKINNSFFLLTNQKRKLKTTILSEIDFLLTKKTKIISKSKIFLEKAQDIFDFIIDNKIDIVILHTHPFDILPLLSLSFKNAPKTILFNHSDHSFCLGAKDVDLTLELREEGKVLSLKYRGTQNSEVVNLPVKILSKNDEKLKIKNKPIVFVSMASWYKYKPFEGQNFLLGYALFLKKNPKVEMYIIGVNEEQFKENIQEHIPNNLFLMGIVPNPKKYLEKADYYIESFPVGSILAAYDSCIYGAIPIFSYESCLIYKEALKNMFPKFNVELNYKTEGEYFSFIEKEIKTRQYYKENTKVVNEFLVNDCGIKWYNNLNKILSKPIELKPYEKMKNKELITPQSKKYARFTSSFSYFRVLDYINSRFELFHPILLFKYIKISIVKVLIK